MSSEPLRAVYDADSDDRTSWAVTVATVAATTLGLVGLFQVLMGVSAVLRDPVYVSTPAYVYRFDLATWGWIHLVLGTVAIAVGVGALLGRTWGVAAGFVVALLVAVTQFVFLPHFPLWGIVQLAFSVAAVWAFGFLLGRSRRSSTTAGVMTNSGKTTRSR